MDSAVDNAPHPDQATQWILNLEEHIHKGGWGQDYSLWICSTDIVSRTRSGASKSICTFAPLPMRGCTAAGIELPVYASVFAEMMNKNRQRRRIVQKNWLSGDLFAVAVAAEALTIPLDQSDGWTEGREWEDHPNVSRLRTVWAFDINDNRYTVNRDQRIGKVTLECGTPVERNRVSESIHTSLRQIRNGLQIPNWM